VSPVKYGLGSYIPEDDILHSDRREHLKPLTFEGVACGSGLLPVDVIHPLGAEEQTQSNEQSSAAQQLCLQAPTALCT
jgi:hypothetical protein